MLCPQIRVNFPNGDMVGHTGKLEATVTACTATDKAVKVGPADTRRCRTGFQTCRGLQVCHHAASLDISDGGAVSNEWQQVAKLLI